MQGTYEFSIIKYPTGNFGFVGSVPVALCDKDGHSKVYTNLNEATKACLAAGVEPVVKVMR